MHTPSARQRMPRSSSVFARSIDRLLNRGLTESLHLRYFRRAYGSQGTANVITVTERRGQEFTELRSHRLSRRFSLIGTMKMQTCACAPSAMADLLTCPPKLQRRRGLFDIVNRSRGNGSMTSGELARATVLTLRSARAAAVCQKRTGLRASRNGRTFPA